MRTRLPHVDVMRGIAMLGILPVNLPYYGVGVAAIDAASVATPLDRALTGFLAVFVERKFITLFAFLFGLGLAMQRRAHEELIAAGRAGPSWGELMARRLGTLFVFGAAHAVFLWFGDVVAIYALVGIAGCALAMWRSARGLAWTGAALVLTTVVVPGLLAALAAVARLDSSMFEGGNWGGGGLDPNAPWPGFVETAFQGIVAEDAKFESAVFGQASFARASVLRGAIWVIEVPSVLLLYGLRLLGLFTLGAAALRSGLADDPAAHASKLRRAAIAGLAAGLPLEAAAWLTDSNDVVSRKLASTAIHELGSLLVAAGYASLVVLWCTRPPRNGLRAAFAAVGRTAFSNYVLQSVAMAFVFTGVGLGLHGELSYAQSLSIVPPIWALAIAVSLLWTRFIGQGPVERAWRAIALAGLTERGTPAPPPPPLPAPPRAAAD